LPHEIVVKGQALDLLQSDIDRILKKRFPYYKNLEAGLQQLFLERMLRFMSSKTFIIKDDEGFREMPVLTSAAAIQLTFGLKDYKLPFYQYIRIYPEEFFRENSFRVLAGNVQDNIISVAWNHFLKGVEHPEDGSNVGLHEMAHALYIQKIVIEKEFARTFIEKYDYLVNECKNAYHAEIAGLKDLYSPYADADLQEFWAESVEIFFEKPHALKQHYPEVYQAMKWLLNQDTINGAHPIIERHLTLQQKTKRVLRLFTKKLGRKNNLSNLV
jgi:Mlc titration factor MtfA (ptsG expression regulator)